MNSNPDHLCFWSVPIMISLPGAGVILSGSVNECEDMLTDCDLKVFAARVIPFEKRPPVGTDVASAEALADVVHSADYHV
ncbi:hypothetical protein BSY16_33 [Sinorhizobium sp. RAC02]|nr:hypothetical protein BSY16_33 [Sinorhizobium sp. RAC02]